jgi:hypothetical protein
MPTKTALWPMAQASQLLPTWRSQPALADAGRADQGQIVVGVDPFALRELLEQSAIKTSGGAVVGVFDACLMAELCSAQPGRQAFVFPPGSLPVEEQGEPVGVRQMLGLIGVGEIGEGHGGRGRKAGRGSDV